jgi:hypothetical protein
MPKQHVYSNHTDTMLGVAVLLATRLTDTTVAHCSGRVPQGRPSWVLVWRIQVCLAGFGWVEGSLTCGPPSLHMQVFMGRARASPCLYGPSQCSISRMRLKATQQTPAGAHN